jgi:hypothetical protein
MDAIKANSGRYKIEDAGINSPYSDYGTTIYANKIVFASARDTGSLGHRRLGPQPLQNCMWQMYEEMSLGSPAKFDKSINSKFNESTPCFTKDGKPSISQETTISREERKDGMTVR